MGVISLGVATASSDGMTVTSGAANTYGSWAVATASSTARVDALHVNVRVGSGTGRIYQIQIGTGGSGSETAIVTFPFRAPGVARSMNLILPLTIPSGTRVTVRCQDPTGSGSLRVALSGQEQSTVAVQGATSGDLITSGGLIACNASGTTSNTFASTTLNASTAADYNAFSLVVVDVATAGATALIRLKDDGATFFEYAMFNITNSDGQPQGLGPIYHAVTAGSSITAEVSSGSTTAIQTQVGLVGYNLTASSSGGGSSLIGPGGLA